MAINPESRKQKAESRNSNPAYRLLPTARYSRGFALLIAIIFMTVMLTLGLSLGSLGYKQTLLSSSAVESQYAFYAADAGLECALYADQQKDSFNYALHTPDLITCDGTVATFIASPTYDATKLLVKERLSLDGGSHCADVTIYKYANLSARFFSQGYNVPCAVVASPGDTRFVSRGLKAQYGI